MKCALAVLAITFLAVGHLLADNATAEPGFYVGTLRVTKVHYRPDDLSASYTLRATARVFPDGSISMAVTAPESPTAASEVEATLDRATPILPPTEPIVLIRSLVVLSGINPVTVRKTVPNYLVDSKYNAELTKNGNVITLIYSNPPAGGELTEVLIPGGETTRLYINDQFTSFKYVLRKVQ
jgi:hypothetical protein